MFRFLPLFFVAAIACQPHPTDGRCDPDAGSLLQLARMHTSHEEQGNQEPGNTNDCSSGHHYIFIAQDDGAALGQAIDECGNTVDSCGWFKVDGNDELGEFLLCTEGSVSKGQSISICRERPIVHSSVQNLVASPYRLVDDDTARLIEVTNFPPDLTTIPVLFQFQQPNHNVAVFRKWAHGSSDPRGRYIATKADGFSDDDIHYTLTALDNGAASDATEDSRGNFEESCGRFSIAQGNDVLGEMILCTEGAVHEGQSISICHGHPAVHSEVATLIRSRYAFVGSERLLIEAEKDRNLPVLFSFSQPRHLDDGNDLRLSQNS